MGLSIRKRPEPEAGTNDSPHLREPFGLKDDKEDDGQSKDEFAKGGDL